MDNIFSATGESYVRLVHMMPVSAFSFLLRANLLLLCPIAIAYTGFSQGLRNPKLQIILMATGLLVACSVPSDYLMIPFQLRPWVFLLALGLWFIPIPFSFLIHPGKKVQEKVVKYTRIALTILFVLNCLIWR